MVLMFHPSNLPPLPPTQFSAMVHRRCSLSARQKCQLTFLLLGKSRGNQWFLKFSLQDCCGLLILQGQRPLKVAHVSGKMEHGISKPSDFPPPLPPPQHHGAWQRARPGRPVVPPMGVAQGRSRARGGKSSPQLGHSGNQTSSLLPMP